MGTHPIFESDFDCLTEFQRIMGNTVAKVPEADCSEVVKVTEFTKSQVQKIYERFLQLDKGAKGYLSRDDLSAIPEFAVNPLAERIVDIFMPAAKDSKCDFVSFCTVLAHFQPTKSDTPEHMPNSGVNKAKLVFHLFDSNHGGTVSKTEVLDVLRYMVGTNIGNENLDAIAERVMVEACRDERDVYEGNMELTFESFKVAMSESVVESKMAVRFQS